LLAGLVFLALAMHLARLLYLAWLRVPDPWPHDWVEGLPALHALTMLRGFPAYHAPTVEAMPGLYGPGLGLVLLPFYAAGAVGLWPGRVLAVGATLLACWLGYRLARQDGATPGEAALAPLLLLVSADATDRVVDMARIDALAYGLFVLGLWASCRRGRWRPRVLVTVMALVAATYTKQSLGLGCLAVIGARMLRRPGEGMRMLLGYGLGGLVLLALFQTWGGGWFYFWAFGLFTSHPWDQSKNAALLLRDLNAGLPLFFLGAPILLALIRCARRRGGEATGLALPGAALGCLVLGTLSRVKVGGHINGWLYAFGAVGLCVAVLPAAFRRVSEGWPEARGAGRVVSLALVLLSLARAFTTLDVDGAGWRRPEAQDRARRYLEALHGFPGPVLAPVLPAVAELAGAGPQISLMTMWDLAYADVKEGPEGLAEALREQRYAAIALPYLYRPYLPGLERSYVPAFALDLPNMQGGNRLPATSIWLPRRPGLQPGGADLGQLREEVPAGEQRRSKPFLARGDALVLELEGGGSGSQSRLVLKHSGLVQRRTLGPGGSERRWVIWELADLVGDELVLELAQGAREPPLRLHQAVMVELPPAARELLELADR
jgi:hypothetical protein